MVSAPAATAAAAVTTDSIKNRNAQPSTIGGVNLEYEQTAVARSLSLDKSTN